MTRKKTGSMPSSLSTGPAVVAIVALVLLLAAVPAVADEAESWPREFETPEATITVYQPQPQSLEGDRLTGSAAVSVVKAGEEDPIFGTGWFDVRIRVDRENRVVDVEEMTVPRVRFPGATDEQEAWLIDVLEREMPKRDLSMSLDQLTASLDAVEQRRLAAEGLNDEPPRIVLSEEPAVLISIDGEPRLRDLEGSDFKYVANTPFMIVLVEKKGTWYLYAGEDRWYSAAAVEGPWQVAKSVPKKVRKLAPEDPELPPEVEEEVSKIPAPTSPPEIVIATEPTELLVTDGEPEYAPLAGGELLYVENSDDDILVEVESQRHFVLLAGRWFAASSLDGPWTMVPADSLPESFRQISAESEMGHLRTWVAGTDEAEEAILDAQVPQTAAIKRDATIDVEWDGEPRFEKIEDTELEHGVNTPEQVLRYENRFYCVHQGVWYTADTPAGPWKVATAIPDVIYRQPASSPTYNTTYVYVYDTTPDVVYTGYYPGYTHSYIYYGVPVWGTGWYYRPWWGPGYYYPRASTWGFHVRYNPWYGWSFGFSYSTGRFTFGLGYGGWGGYHRGWWGPVGYRPYYRAAYSRGWRSGYRAGYWAGQRHRNYSPNLYARPANAARNARPVTMPRATAASNVARGKANNLYAGPDGNVYRRNADGTWQRNLGGKAGGWENVQVPRTQQATPGQLPTSRPSSPAQQPATRPSTPGQRPSTPSQRPTTGAQQATPRPPAYGGTGSLNTHYQARQRGAASARGYGASRPMRGGGRRR
jgi:hypothetical protein